MSFSENLRSLTKNSTTFLVYSLAKPDLPILLRSLVLSCGLPSGCLSRWPSVISSAVLRFWIITMIYLFPTLTSWRLSCRLLPTFEEVDSKLTRPFSVSMWPRQSGRVSAPSSGSNTEFRWSKNCLTNLGSAAAPVAGFDPNTKVKLAILTDETAEPSPRVFYFSVTSPVS